MRRRILVLFATASLAAVSAVGNAGAAQKILYLGDSMSMGAFGKKLDDEMRDTGLEVYTYVAGGATPYYWLSRYQPISSSIGYWQKTPKNDVRKRYIKAVPKVEALINEHQPDVVVVQTGTNLYATLRSKQRTKEDNIREIEGLLEQMAKTVTSNGCRVYWITPPDAHVSKYPVALQEEMAGIMKRVVGKYGAVFDSRSVTKFTDPYPQTDGIHYGPTEASQWAQVVANDFKHFVHIGAGEFLAQATTEQDAANALLAASSPPSAPHATELGQEDIPRAIISENQPGALAMVGPDMLEGSFDQPERTGGGASPRQALPAAATPEAAKPALPAAPEPEVAATDTPADPDLNADEHRLADDPGVVPPAEWKPVVANLRLIRKSTVEHVNSVTYHNCLVLYEYEVLSLDSGEYPYKTIRVAETGVFSRRKMPALGYEIGKVRSLKLDPLAFYPTLEQWQLNDDLPVRIELPVFIPSMRD